jgi:hypothetical protein
MSNPDQPFTKKFDTDVPAHLQDDILTRIVEAAWEHAEDPEINIIDCKMINALNIEFSGTVMIDGREHDFHMRDGNNNGTEIISWNEDTGVVHEPAPTYALVPTPGDIGDAIYRGRAREFLMGWEKDLDPHTERGRILSDLAEKRAYDGFFAPGSGAGHTHAKTAKNYGYTIEHYEDAVAARKKLLVEALCITPTGTWPRQTPQEARAVYEAWTDYRKKGEIAAVIHDTAERLSRSKDMTPNTEETARLKAMGFSFATRSEETRAWKTGLSGLYGLRDMEDFDPATLPEDPIKELMEILDPSLVHDKRVNPRRACEDLLDAVTTNMARNRIFEVSDADREKFNLYGFIFDEKAPTCWIVDESGIDVAIYQASPRDRGSDGRTYRIEEDTVTGIEFDTFEDGWLVFGVFDRHDVKYSEQENDTPCPGC